MSECVCIDISHIHSLSHKFGWMSEWVSKWLCVYITATVLCPFIVFDNHVARYETDRNVSTVTVPGGDSDEV